MRVGDAAVRGARRDDAAKKFVRMSVKGMVEAVRTIVRMSVRLVV